MDNADSILQDPTSDSTVDGALDIHRQVELDRSDYAQNLADIRRFRLYCQGKQDSTLTKDQQVMLKGVLGNLYCDNICSQIVSEHSDRLELTGWKVTDKKTQEWLDTFWAEANMDSLQARCHRRMVRDGNYCLMVVWDEKKQRVVVQYEPWWDGQKGVFIAYDAQGNMLYAVKEWDTVSGHRRTVYWEGYLQRFISAGGGASAWTEYSLPGETPGPVPYERPDGTPLHIPFIHLVHEGDTYDNYGSSVLDGGVIGAQDQINDLQYDMSAAGRMTGYQMMWSKGYKLKRDSRNQPIQPKVGPGTWVHAEEDSAAFGTIPAGDLTPLISLYTEKVKSVCRMTRTPFHVITGNWPSGEALYRAELPLVNKSLNQIKRLKPAWVQVAHRATELANVYGKAGLDEDLIIGATFADPARVDAMKIAMGDQAFWQAAASAVQAGLPLETFLRMQGWTEQEITAYYKDLDAQTARNLVHMAQQQQLLSDAQANAATQ